jgi:hypothetical protein
MTYEKCTKAMVLDLHPGGYQSISVLADFDVPLSLDIIKEIPNVCVQSKDLVIMGNRCQFGEL